MDRKLANLMEKTRWRQFQPRFLPTGVGSLPHLHPKQAIRLIAQTLPQTPFWPQLPKYNPLENMNVQVSPGLPFLKIDEEKGEVRFDRACDQAGEMERVYSAYLAGDVEAFRLPERYAGGLEETIHFLKEAQKPLQFFKGQIPGPITFGLSVQDPQGKDVIHNEVIFDALLKGLILRGRWMIRRMKSVCEAVLLFIDEPALAGYGSAFFSVEAATVVGRLNEVIEEFQAEGAWVGIHCCGNTDWPLLLSTKADVLNFDAWGFLETLSLYPEALQDFLSRDGVLAWGIVPTTEFTGKESSEEFVQRMEQGFRRLAQKGIRVEQLRERCLLTSSCGMGLMDVEKAEKAMHLLAELSKRMQEKYL